MITYYKIYKNDDPTIFYIGSTLNFSRRKFQHKKNTRNKVGKLYHTLLYKTIRDNGGWDNFTIESIWENEEHNLRYLEERAIINILQPPLNRNNPTKEKPSEEILIKFKDLKT
jgi:hypothetical protein